eukprot:Phypoly_transcript_18997.p1 GENE.Phypoly_transcript_18997~~Phypoly_transcript_18997.p1  ORF type:complete len:180 (+),score=30.02 Phypoly_transcript_18997:151-690(+)
MHFVTCILLLSLLSLVSSQTPPTGTCTYALQNNVTLLLPPAQPNSPGDVNLISNNSIILANGSPLNPGEGCNGDDLWFLDNNVWTNNYTGCDHENRTGINIIYATGENIQARTIQTWQANLGQILNNKTVRLNIVCNNGVTGCIQLVFNGTQVGHCSHANKLHYFSWASAFLVIFLMVA